MKYPWLRSAFAVLALSTHAIPTTARADMLLHGSATLDLDPAAWASVAGGANLPGFEALILDEVFDQAAASARTATQILSDEIVANPASTGIVFTMNGSVVQNLAGRTAQPTSFEFVPGDLTGHTGVIGLGGVTRWAVNPLLGGGGILLGDFTLSYDALRLQVGGSGWQLRGNIAPAGVVFDLQNVTAEAGEGSFTLAGDLGVSFELANFLFATPADQGKDVGDFTFSAVTAVPEPETAATLAALGCAAVAAGVSRRRARRG